MVKNSIFCCKVCGCADYHIKYSNELDRMIIICDKCDTIKDQEHKSQVQILNNQPKKTKKSKKEKKRTRNKHKKE